MAVKERVGVVVSDKMDKTVVVAIENRTRHPKYRKIVVQTKKYKAHDEENQCKTGDRVRIQETRPLSKTKRWIVAEILTHVAGTKNSTSTTATTPETPETP
ncbi:30S ribosomal protein S17 [Gloeothece verrucosa]|uniref:Small ribosomal subunit protein uS17 n=1 Tax=Gloeothece verrucosa (strain PCC 7822) TaxID=497965 RepID=E0UJC4_GLOV7|nr:30S ribosomal protein S17 [Gloeothece verrucosa]ADN16942.1 30S ribosomal protein S17 [Gloeothece verrucosa PCC 7822]